MAEKIFIDGMIAKRRDNAPDFVLCNISVKCEDFEKFMKANHKNGWLNINVQRSKSGKVFAELDTWEPNKQGGQQQAPPRQQGYNAPPPQNNTPPPRDKNYDPEMGF